MTQLPERPLSSQAQTPRLMMHGIHKRFGATRALAGVDFSVAAGTVHALVGENGAGKSTLMKVLSGAHHADTGWMELDGQRYQPAGPLEARRAGVAMIYQELSLVEDLSVMENILLGMEPTAGPLIRWSAMRQCAQQALDQVGGSDILPEVKVSRLSVAQKQLVEIARAVAVGCRVLVLDEPTSSLTENEVGKLFELIGRLRAKNQSIIYISHVLEEVQQISDRFSVLRDGQTVGEGVTVEAEVEKIIALMVGRELSHLYPRSEHPMGAAVLEVTQLSGIELPRSASLTLHRGEVLGIAGLVGAGRTELVRAIFGLNYVQAGHIKVGFHSGTASPSLRWQQGVGMVSEDRAQEGLALELSVAENVTLSKLTGLGPWRWVTPGRQSRASERWIKKMAIKCVTPGQSVDALSGGNQQKVAMARLLHHDVDVLLLDEPTRGIDVGSKAQIYKLIDELAVGDEVVGRPPRAVLMVSSYLPELLGVCDQIAVMCRGRLSPAKPVAEWDENRLLKVAMGREQVA